MYKILPDYNCNRLFIKIREHRKVTNDELTFLFNLAKSISEINVIDKLLYSQIEDLNEGDEEVIVNFDRTIYQY